MKFLLLALFCSNAFSMFPGDENPYTYIPRHTKFEFIYGRNIKLPAGTTSIELAKIELDADSDSVPDYADWCPNTHADYIHAVWTKANIKNNPEEWIGCSFSGKGSEFSLQSYNETPKGIVHTFKLEYESSFSERILSGDVVFEVMSSGNKLLNGEYDQASIINLLTEEGMSISMRADTREQSLIGNEIIKKFHGSYYIVNFEPTKKMSIENFKRIFKFKAPLPNSIIVR